MTNPKAAALSALIQAKQEFAEIKKDKTGPRGTYASLDSVLSSTNPQLLKYGLMVVQNMQHATHENGEVCVWLETRIFHESGEELPMVSQYPLNTNSDPQKFGAALTYARRYSYCALLGVTADEDDDANNAAGKAKQTSSSSRNVSRPPTPPHTVSYASAAELKPISECLANAGMDSDARKEWMRDNGAPDLAKVPRSKLNALQVAAQASAKAAQDPAVLASKSLAGAMGGDVLVDA
jgi:hypothetical protein